MSILLKTYGKGNFTNALVALSLLSLLSTPDALRFVFLSFIHSSRTNGCFQLARRHSWDAGASLRCVGECVHKPSVPRVEEEQRGEKDGNVKKCRTERKGKSDCMSQTLIRQRRNKGSS